MVVQSRFCAWSYHRPTQLPLGLLMPAQWLVRLVMVPPTAEGGGELDQLVASAGDIAKEAHRHEAQLAVHVAVREPLAIFQFAQVVVAVGLDDVVAGVGEVRLGQEGGILVGVAVSA